ncbi:fungal-specific transcription factor domain-containing protein [Sphaerosporella brunnea]|uniref:Fungal-specific transcription factor domain-containing protein n=1 Tax=Sphaerosporella brunnea TaxID=1250544 RepID=A0A5J5F584_9PEZI|nr:fungal-specific transcription factor domain-containing protein [Sphaerosporella brunnea]
MNDPVYEQQQQHLGEAKSPNPLDAPARGRRPRSVSERSDTHADGGRGGGTESQSGGGGPKPKRSKVATACDECRLRKSRCDGEKPCGPCTRKGKSPDRCTYQNDPMRATVSQSYIEELEARIRHLESANAAAASSMRSMDGRYPAIPCYDPLPNQMPQQQLAPGFLTVDGVRTEIGMSPIGAGISSGAMASQPGRHVHRSSIKSATREAPGFIIGHSNDLSFGEDRRFSGPVAPKDTADAMGTILADNDDKGEGDENHSFFGSSSAFSFMKHIKRTVAKKRSSSLSPQDVDFRALASNGMGGMEPPVRQTQSRDDDGFLEDLEDFVLPRRDIADHLIDCYWTWVHSLYPFFHRPTFMATYEQLWTGSEFPHPGGEPGVSEVKPPGRMFRCILNLIFAFGCQFSSSIPSSRRDSSSDVFFKRSRLLLHVDILGSGSILLVQALLLMGQYLQSTKYPNRCWNVAGLAIRVAQGLGMHLDTTSANRKSVVEREVWRRTWHGCILLDRVVSMTFGRPSMVSLRTQVSLPLPIDDENLSDDPPHCEQPPGIPSRVELFIHTLKLYEILGEILSIFYDSSGGGRGASGGDRLKYEGCYQSVLRLDKMLLDFQRRLPPYLRQDMDEHGQLVVKRDACFLRQTNVIYASRYLNIRILLFRPILINLIQDSQIYTDHKCDRLHPTTLLESSLAIDCSIFCVQAAQKAIDLISGNLDSGAVPAWWYYIFFLLAAKLCPNLEEKLDHHSLELSWKKCVGILRSLEDRYEPAKRCLATLVVLHEQIISSENGIFRGGGGL